MAPETPDKMTMGTSVQWYSVETDEPAPFPECPWALQFTEESCEQHHARRLGLGGRAQQDQIAEIESIRDHSLRADLRQLGLPEELQQGQSQIRQSQAVLGRLRRGQTRVAPAARRRDPDQQDVQKQRVPRCVRHDHVDHRPALPRPGEHQVLPRPGIQDVCKTPAIKPYPIPYRCFYSRNIENLFMAGRDISVTHVALGTVRVMRTCGMMGEVVGMAASLCKKHDATPRGVYESHLAELRNWRRGVGRQP